MISKDTHTAIAVLGGTFDPIHHGHLRLAIDLAEQLNLSSLKLMPDYQPMHRDTPSATAEQRLEMLKLAICDNSILDIDSRELKRKGPSYTLLSLKEIRAEIGPTTPLYFVLGEDAFCHFDEWHQPIHSMPCTNFEYRLQTIQGDNCTHFQVPIIIWHHDFYICLHHR